MDSFEFNKIAGAVLGTVLLVMGLGVVADTIFSHHDLETPGYSVEVPEDGTTTEVAAAPEEEPISILLASASADDGQSVAKKCAACHNFVEGGANKVGPNLWNVVNAVPAAHDGFKYSSALQEYAASNVWAYENLNSFLKAPKKYISGTSMGFAGLKKADERADLIAYLRTLSNDPAPLPEVTPASAETPAEEAPAEEAPAAEEKPDMEAPAEPAMEQPATEAPETEAPAEGVAPEEGAATEAPAEEQKEDTSAN